MRLKRLLTERMAKRNGKPLTLEQRALRGLKLKDENVIIVLKDESCEMAEVQVNGVAIYLGNYWDYHQGCYGGNLDDALLKHYGEYSSPDSYATMVKLFILEHGKKKVRIEHGPYTHIG